MKLNIGKRDRKSCYSIKWNISSSNKNLVHIKKTNRIERKSHWIDLQALLIGVNFLHSVLIYIFFFVWRNWRAEMDSSSISTALQNMDVGGGSGNMEDAMQNFIKNHVLSNPITCESTKTKWVIKCFSYFSISPPHSWWANNYFFSIEGIGSVCYSNSQIL